MRLRSGPSARSRATGSQTGRRSLHRRALHRPVAAAGLVLAALVGGAATPAGAGGSNDGQPQVIINPGGGGETNGSDGLRVILNSNGTAPANATGSDQLVYGDAYQYCCDTLGQGGGPMLNIGGTLYGEGGPALLNASWTSIQLVGVTGKARTQGELDTGSGTAHFRYTATVGGLDYMVDRVVRYRHPSSMVTEDYTVTIPAGNTDVVKFYYAGDAAPGGQDNGFNQGVAVTAPARAVYAVNTVTDTYLGLGEVPGGEPFDGAVTVPWAPGLVQTVEAGSDIGLTPTASDHDSGIAAQWTLGSTPGTYERSLRQYVGPRGTDVRALFRTAEAEVGDEVILDLVVLNTGAAANTDVDVSLELPSGLVIGDGATTNTCTGTLTATAGTELIQLADGTVNTAANCVVSVPVTAAEAGIYAVQPISATVGAGVNNSVGADQLTVTNPAAVSCQPDQGWNVVVDQVSRLYGAALGRTPDDGGLVYWTRLRLDGLTVQGLATNLLASSERDLTSGTQTNTQFVEELYLDVLGRASDTDGRTYWVGQLDAGLTRAALVVLFAESPENVTRTGTLSPMSDAGSMTCRIYETLFHRTPDDGGFAYWSGLLAGGLSPTQVANLMLATSEGTPLTSLSNEAFVGHLYEGALNRPGDPAGLDYWEAQVPSHGRGPVTVWLANVYEGAS